MFSLSRVKISIFFVFLAILFSMPIAWAYGGEPGDNYDGDGVLDEDESLYLSLETDSSPSNSVSNEEAQEAAGIVEEWLNDDEAADALNEDYGGITDNDGTQQLVDQDVEYEVTPVTDYETGEVIGYTIEGVPQEEEIEIDPGWEPIDPPQPVWVCYNPANGQAQDGEGMDRRKYDSGSWIGAPVDCGSSTGWGSWSCKNDYEKHMTRTEKGCNNGSCYSNTTDEETIDCVFGCENGKCQPLASFSMSPNPTDAGQTITFNAEPSMDSYEGESLSFEWFYEKTEGAGDYVKIGEGKTLEHLIETGSIHKVKLEATSTGMPTHPEDNGTSAEAEQNLTVNEAPHPNINAPTECIVPCSDITINAIGTTDAEDPVNALTYEWDYDNDGTTDETFNSDQLPGTHAFEWKTYTIKLKVTDTEGNWAEDTHTLQVKNNAPTVNYQMIPFPASGLTPLTIKFIDESSDPDNHAITYWEWDFGDMETETGTPETQHVYQDPGDYPINLTVRDEYGAEASKPATVRAKKRAAIKYLNSTDPKTIEDETITEITCNKPTTARINYYDADGKTITDEDGNPIQSLQSIEIPCNENATIIQANGFPQPGIYQINATITSELCDNCPQTEYIVVGEKVQEKLEAQTPDIPSLLAMAIAGIVLAIIRRK